MYTLGNFMNALTSPTVAVAMVAAALGWGTAVAQGSATPAAAAQVAGAAAGQLFDFGSDDRNSDEPDVPSQRYIPRLFRQQKESQAPRQDPFQQAAQSRAVEMLTGGEKATARRHLEKGRAALAQGDLIAAEGWYHKAKATGVEFSADEYSPEKLATELTRAGVNPQRLHRSGGAAESRAHPPRQALSPKAAQLPASASGRSVFAQRVGGESGPAPQVARAPAERPRSSFTAGRPQQAAGEPPSAGDRPSAPAGATARYGQLLHDARSALAAGDVRRAGQLVAQAERMGVRAPGKIDSHEKVRELLKRHQRLASAIPPAGPRAASPQAKRDYALFLMEQADGLIEHRDLDVAEKLARQAFRLEADYGSIQRTPARQLAQIAQLRNRMKEGVPPRRLRQPSRSGGPRQPVQVSRLPAKGGAKSETGADRKDEAVALLAKARAALARGDLEHAERLAQTANSFNVPDRAFGPNDEHPWMVLIDIERARRRRGPVQTAGGLPEGPRSRFSATPGVYRPGRHPGGVRPAQAVEPTPPNPDGLIGSNPGPDRSSAGPNLSRAGHDARRLFDQGEKALQDHKLKQAVELFRQAWKHERQLDPITRHRLQTYLQQLAAQAASGDEPHPKIDDVEARQQVLLQQLFGDVSRGLRQAQRQREEDPKGAMEQLKKLRDDVASSDVQPAIRDQQLRRIDREMKSLAQYIEENRAQIEQDERNRQVLADVEGSRARRIEIQETMATLVDDFNRLMDEHQFAEAEAIARQARELDPESEYVQMMLWKSKFVRRMQSQIAIREMKEEGFVGQLEAVDESSIGFDDRDPYRFPNVRYWDQLTRNRRKHAGDRQRRLTEADIQIYRALKTKVDVNFEARPLAEVIHTLAAGAGVNVHLDRQGLAAEGITSDTPVTIRLTQPISLRSALNHILHELRLSYLVQDEVLKITSEQMRESDVYRQVYNVADLVLPIPNFTPSYNIGLAAALRQAHADLGHGWVGGRLNEVPLQVATGEDSSHINPLALGQVAPRGFGGRAQQPVGLGPGGVSGGVQPDFDSLIDLITATVDPTTWDEVGGPGTVMGFETNLSLVISQTQEVHDEIVDLLEQLRRLQDLQVTIEVRFITLNDNFFERIGVDFNFDIQDGVTEIPVNGSPSAVIGLGPDNQPTADLDLQFSQGGFTAAVPQFGGFDAATAANFGFAILGEIEAFFLIQAAQGDTRTNVMQAPKVTLFNGQQAFVSDTSQQPFVTSIIPVVGDFAAAHQPVIVVLSEGTSLSVQAVVSNDRRFVRLTIVPFFSKIGDVQEFTFNGKRTTRNSISSSEEGDEEGGGSSNSNEEEELIEGTTVQLPTFSFVTVTTTVSVPDGGTVLLGGIKRLSEGRSERGVPVMNKLPYINRLFKNVGIGRETQSLMMMVTPRIIIQEEEEEKLGIGGFGTGSP